MKDSFYRTRGIALVTIGALMVLVALIFGFMFYRGYKKNQYDVNANSASAIFFGSILGLLFILGGASYLREANEIKET